MKIFDIQNDTIVVNENVLLLPWLKEVHDRFGIPALCYLYYMTDPHSPFTSYPEESKEDEILKAFPGDYIPDDVYIVKALEELLKMYESPKMRFWKGLKHKLDQISQMLIDTPLNMDKETGNFNEIIKLYEKGEKLLNSYDKAEKLKEEELRAVGNRRQAYDQV